MMQTMLFLSWIISIRWYKISSLGHIFQLAKSIKGIASWSIMIRFFLPFLTLFATYLILRGFGISFTSWRLVLVIANYTAFKPEYTTRVFSMLWGFCASLISFKKFSTQPEKVRWLQNVKARFILCSFCFCDSLRHFSRQEIVVLTRNGLNSWKPAN